MIDLATELGDLVDTLVDAGIRAALDPVDLNLPGVLVGLDPVQGIALDRLTDTCGTLHVRLLLVHGDTSTLRAYEGLQTLLNTLLDVIDPAGPITPAAVRVVPGDTPLPALAYPATIYL